MAKPDTQNSDFPEVDDRGIKKLLASRQRRAQKLGLIYLDHRKREKMFGLMRIWSKRYGWYLESSDIAQIWEDTLNSIDRNVVNGKFRVDGSLNGYVRTITYRRACDYLDRRVPVSRDADVESVGTHSVESTASQLADVLRDRIPKLTRLEKLVIRHWVRLCRINNKLPLVPALTESINQQRPPDKQLSRRRVSKLKRSAMRKLKGERQ